MKAIGTLSTVAGLAIMGAGALLFVRSLPEIRRYMKIRNM